MGKTTITKLSHYEGLTHLLEYPGADYLSKIKVVETVIRNEYPLSYPVMHEYVTFIEGSPLQMIEELYTRTFDVQAITTLDIGYVLFGDEYKRGKLLANLNKEAELAGIDLQNELPDHLPNVLKLLSKLKDEELRNDLVNLIIMPSLKMIIDEFKVQKVNLKNKIYQKEHKSLIEQSKSFGRIYSNPLRVIYAVLKEDFDYTEPKESGIKNSFTESVQNEFKLD